MHPAVARDLKNLAKFFKVWNRSTEALPIMQRVIDILQFMERKSGSPVSTRSRVQLPGPNT